MPDEYEPSWLAGLPEEPEEVTYSDSVESPAEPAKPKARIKVGTNTPPPPKTAYEPFHW